MCSRNFYLHNCNRNSHLLNWNRKIHHHTSNKKYHLKTCINATYVVTCIIAIESVSCMVPTETSPCRIDYRNFNLQKWCQSIVGTPLPPLLKGGRTFQNLRQLGGMYQIFCQKVGIILKRGVPLLYYFAVQVCVCVCVWGGGGGE